MTPTELFIYRVAAALFVALCATFIALARALPPPYRGRARAFLALCAVAVALMSVVACGGGNVVNGAPPWQMTIEAACAAPAACPTFPLLDGTPRPTAVTTPRPGFPTATPPPLTEAEALATRQPAAMTAAAEGMVARATEEARP
jgi:hypothetical protein